VDLGRSFRGKLADDDSANASDFDGAVFGSNGIASIADWTHFDSRYRGWGADGDALPDPTNAGRCTGRCQIWDLRLAAADAVLYRQQGATPTETLTPGRPCPAAAHGDQVVSDQQAIDYFPGISAVELAADGRGDDDGTCEPDEACFNRFLAHAVEIMVDELGDDDGLCESDETCLYAPSFGADQGGDEPTPETCEFQDGLVSGVTLHDRAH
jgi:hypothetical protein